MVLPFFISLFSCFNSGASFSTMQSNARNNAVEKIIHYHEVTKHRYERYARSPGYMDWQNQPNPFRFYREVPLIKLPLLQQFPGAPYAMLYQRENSPKQPFGLENIAGFLELSLGLSAWKAAGQSRWSLRINPSSGNLHPTEAHLVLPPSAKVPGGIFHYNVFAHALEQRAAVAEEIWRQIEAHFGGKGFMIGLSSIFWRESWKYGERAYRYCNHDAGHALAAISMAGNLFGWKVTYLNGLSDNALNLVLGLNQTRFEHLEEEHPDFLCFVHPNDHAEIPRTLPPSIIDAFAKLKVAGRPNQLSKQRIDWQIIYQTADQTQKPATADQAYKYSDAAMLKTHRPQRFAAEIIRQRRSATDFDRRGSLLKHQLLSMLDKTLPRSGYAPFDAELIEASTHLFLFIHRIEGLASGLYFFGRNQKDLDPLKRQTHSEFRWRQIKDNFPLYLLKKGDFRQQARMISCHQDIAGSSVLSLGMVARFKDTISARPYHYRHLFAESGMIGQVLYLEAEAHGVRGTGIGCFFDDAMHEIIGLQDNRYQSLYHFTIGRPIEDPRLATFEAYHHLKDR